MKKIIDYFICLIANFFSLPKVQHVDDYERLGKAYQNSMDVSENLDGSNIENLNTSENRQQARFVGNVGTTFNKQFDLTVTRKWFSGLANPEPTAKFPVFLYNPTDYQSNYSEGIKNVQIPAGFTYDGCFVTPNAYWNFIIPGLNLVPDGSIVFLYVNALGEFIYIIVECANVGYSLLLNGIMSGKFKIKMMRYSLPSPTLLAQYSNAITVYHASMFGKKSKDDINPKSFKNPNEQIPNIIDIPVIINIDKTIGLYTLVNIGQTFDISMFIEKV